MIFENEIFTEKELYNKLGFSHSPSDRELEAKIIYFLKKYNDDGETPNSKLYDFFSDVYDFFFDTDAFAEKDDENLQMTIENVEEGFVSGSAANQDEVSTNLVPSVPSVSVVNAIPYSKDIINPLLKQTVQRIVSIDSKIRDINASNSKTNSISTDFTLELSEPLKNVVSLKLYSYQIPYTWYTISKDYGSNFFFLKGISPGLSDSGNFDYKIDISAGNYSAVELTTAINNKFTQVKQDYLDVSFGKTQLTYNTFDTRATFTIDIQNIYNESTYYLDWTIWSSPLNPDRSNLLTNLPIYMGFNSRTYDLNTIYSVRNAIPSISQTSQSDNFNNIYYIGNRTDFSNNYFRVIHYLNPVKTDSYSNSYIDNYIEGVSTILEILFVQSSLSTGKYTRNAIQTDFQNQIQNSIYLASESHFTRIDRTDVTYSYFELAVPFSKKTTLNYANSKKVVSFPVEPIASLPTDSLPLWSGSQSCFQFDLSFVELSNLLSEVNLFPSNYLQNILVPIINMQCNAVGYVNAINDVIISVVPASNPNIGYNINEYLGAINSAFVSADVSGIFNFVPSGNSGISINSSYNAEINFDYNLVFSNKNYTIDFTGSLQFTNDGIGQIFSGVNIDLVTQSVFTNSIPILSRYLIDVDVNGRAVEPIFTIIPKSGNGNSGSGSFVVPFLNTRGIRNGFVYTYILYSDFLNDYNDSINFFVDNAGSYIINGCAFTIVLSGSSYNYSLRVNVLKTLTQHDFVVYLYDLSGGSQQITGVDSSWYNELNFTDISYNLSDSIYNLNPPASIITSSSKVNGSTIDIYDNSNNYFYLKPKSTSDGLYTKTAGDVANYFYNDIRVSIPSGTYTTIELFNALNSSFSDNEITRGTYIESVKINGLDYVYLRMNINKIFTAYDYVINFYDTISFVDCYVGSKSVRNTTWDTTLGWILGFQEQTIYYLGDYANITEKIARITGEKSVNVNLYSYFLLVVDDYNQNRLNDGLVTISKSETQFRLPSYSSLANYGYDDNGDLIATGSSVVASNNLSLNQIYSINQILCSKKPVVKVYSQGPFVKDIFGIIPIKTSGLSTGEIFTEYGGSLQNQERLYFGPVNIQRLQVQLYNDQGNIMDLNGANWSFSFVVEQLYQMYL